MSTVAVVVFPGSNCEHDVVRALRELGGDARLVWHGDDSLGSADAVVLPGGFAHGDYLRPGAIARFSPVMSAVARFAADGGPVVGICNGFQVLTEAGLLPGALRRNSGLRFVCETVTCTVVSSHSVLTAGVSPGTRLSLPINHGEGSFTCDPDTLARLESSGQVVLRYDGDPNGSVGRVAGVASREGNVVGLMPHPERASAGILGSDDGVVLLESLLHSASRGRPRRAVVSI
ncbi:MAG: phosphoribosylformylglycinamidine synthase subunit PurQ [Actinomycetota bacterium]|nr:phosphoribosylformylglycinamidine synthase subunit PurQ [Actinomycetota bacterium]